MYMLTVIDIDTVDIDTVDSVTSTGIHIEDRVRRVVGDLAVRPCPAAPGCAGALAC
ncbi:hypothetical protein [Micromonospora sp. S4605]|uniref:hypothetical protein n=1 Tax=Micromonospora sp. S4605 TaxID=1420897 RepID=UPI0013051B65|nr:hypothetical protein [Micromonospora sp. S4605]